MEKIGASRKDKQKGPKDHQEGSYRMSRESISIQLWLSGISQLIAKNKAEKKSVGTHKSLHTWWYTS